MYPVLRIAAHYRPIGQKDKPTMASVSLPKPGTKYGPCKHNCKHIECAQTRRMVKQLCRFCNEAIDYDRQFNTDPDNQDELVHAVCLEEWVIKQR